MSTKDTAAVAAPREVTRQAQGLRAISLQQPWAWLVVNGYKTFENRERAIAGPGPGIFYVHASLKLRMDEWKSALTVARRILPKGDHEFLPTISSIETGGIVGVMELGEYVGKRTEDPWSFGAGYPVLWAAPAPYITRCRGALHCFEPHVVISGICAVCGCTDEDCSRCVERTGAPCSWTNRDQTLCSACIESGVAA